MNKRPFPQALINPCVQVGGVTLLALIRGKEENVIEHAGLTAKGDGSIGLISCHFFSEK